MKKKVVMGIVIALGTTLFLLFLGFVWFMTGEPVIRVNYVKKLNELVRPAGATDDQNAWNDYERAMQLYAYPDDIVSDVIGSVKWEDESHYRFSKLAPEDQEKIQRWVVQNKGEYEKLIKQDETTFKVMISDNDMMDTYRYSEYEILKTYLPGVLAYEEEHDRLYLMGWRISEKIIKEDFPEKWHRGLSAVILDKWIKRCQVEEKYITNWLKQNEETWQSVLAGNKKPYCWYSYDESKTMWEGMNRPGWCRTLGRLGIWRTIIEREESNYNRAIDECFEVISIGKKIKNCNDPPLAQLNGISILDMGYDQLFRILAYGTFSHNKLFEVQQRLEKVHADGYPLVKFESERLFFLDSVQLLFTDGGPGGGHMIPRQTEGVPAIYYNVDENIFTKTYYCFLHAGRNKTIAKANEMYDEFNKLVEYRPYQVKHGEVKKMKELPSKKYQLVYALFPNDSYIIYDYRSKSMYESLLLVLSLQRWELEQGIYPERLEELREGGYLEELPDDPYGPGVLAYERRGGDFILYSWGEDFDDDGGVENPNSFWGRGEEGGDYVFWPIKNE
ncbi:MAG: hypothetical protein AMJ79_10845 [Phycisphaerae bacterium SM23_30]|nr:MAG: hypothetical protein AMJ79_10845 [Phycisphaerae bacterium SM23_30]